MNIKKFVEFDEKIYNKSFSIFSIISISYFIGYLLVLIIFGKSSYITIHDILDSVIVWYTPLKNSHSFFSLNPLFPIDQIMNGIPRGCMITGFNIHSILYRIFSPFIAYVINDLLMHIIAFLGMYLLLKKHTLNGKDNIILLGTSIAFATLPFYNIFGISIAGIPLLVYAFLNILKGNNHIRDYIIIFFYPLYSFFFFIGPFVIMILIILLAYFWIKNKKINKNALIVFFVFLLLFLLTEINIFNLFIFKHFNMNREEMNPIYFSYNFKTTTKIFLKIFLHGHYHAATMNYYLAIIILPIFLFFSFFKKIKSKELPILLGTILFISLIYAVRKYEPIAKIRSNVFLLRAFQWDRLYFLLPVFWYLFLALFLIELKKFKGSRIFIVLILLFQIVF
ncbi:hypothetical protein J7L48_07845, partial [bacterium]|nr:hypothetical protein [bacterium]